MAGSTMQWFSDFIFSHGLVAHLPMEGGNFIWSNSLSHFSTNRFLLTLSLEEFFSLVTQRRLPWLLSDHQPILLVCTVVQWGLSQFWFENMWLKVDVFVDKVKGWWDSYQFNISPNFVLANKLKALKLDLKKWNIWEFGNITRQKDCLLYSINSMDEIEETRVFLDDEKV